MTQACLDWLTVLSIAAEMPIPISQIAVHVVSWGSTRHAK
jgi:hypothetical protein